MSVDAWITMQEAESLSGVGQRAVSRRVQAGDIEARTVGGARRLRREDVLAVWPHPREDRNPGGLTRLQELCLRELAARGGESTAPSGRAVAALGDAIEARYGYRTRSVSTTVKELVEAGLVDREGSATRTHRVWLTGSGRTWLAAHPAAPTTAVVPREAAVVPAERLNGQRAGESPPVDAGPPPRAPEPVEPVEPDAIARALLRQAVRTLADSDVATLTAERDALRVHNTSLVARLAEAVERADRAEREAREVRGVLHGIEMQLTPMLAGPDASFGWLDARTRTDLLAMVGEAARWAAS